MLADERTFFAAEAVQNRRFTGVRTTDQGDASSTFVFGLMRLEVGLVFEIAFDLRTEIPDAAVVGGTDARHLFDAEFIEFQGVGFVFFAVHFVDDIDYVFTLFLEIG